MSQSPQSQLYSFLNEISHDKSFYIDLLKYEIDNRFYYYGKHFYRSFEDKSEGPSFKDILVEKLIEGYVLLKNKRTTKGKRVNIFSTAYFNLQDKIKDDRINITRPPWQYNERPENIYDYKLFKKAKSLKKTLNYGGFSKLLSDQFINELIAFEESLKHFIVVNNIVALFLPADVGLFERLTIKIFKELGYPSFIFLHGLPGGYVSNENNRTDYLVVWGEAIKKNFINAGISSEKIIVSGHPSYQLIDSVALLFSLDDVLVVTKPLQGTQFGGRYVLRDRSNLICYLMMVQTALQKCGVKKARLRTHPSENPKWYMDCIDNSFFIIDTDHLNVSLKKSTLVIGPTSTVFIEALISEINYLVFEPRQPDGTGFDGNVVVPPFDGSDPKVPVATTVAQIENILNQKKSVDISVLNDYVSEVFSSEKIIDLILQVKY